MTTMKNLKKWDYVWVQESNETNADVDDTCMVQCMCYQLEGLPGEKEERDDITHVAPIRV